MFKLALKEAGLKANDCVFIDDRKILLDTPKNMGFHTILYQSPTQLEKELKLVAIS
jgi:HAD superfamily hydrolase (TIGR01509 family)